MNKLLQIIFCCVIIPFSVYGQGTGDTIRAIFIDEHDVKWFGSDRGLLRFDGADWIAYNTQFDTPGVVNAIEKEVHETYGSEIWLGTNAGAAVASYSADGISSATRFHTGNSELLSNEIVAVEIDEVNNRYFATPVGLAILVDDYWIWMENGWGPSEAGVPSSPLQSLGSKNDTIYIGAQDRGSGRIIRGVDAYSGASYYETQWSEIIGNNVRSIFSDSDGYQWFGTTTGVCLHTTQDGEAGWDLALTTSDGLANNNVNAIFEDSKGDFWFATDGGISKYVIDGGVFNNYTVAEGLANNVVYDIAEDQSGVLWFGTANGVSSFNETTFTNFNTGDQAKDFENIIINNIDFLLPGTDDKFKIYPNPASSQLYVHFEKELDMVLSIDVYNMSGKHIKNLFNGYAGGGDLKVRWDLSDMQNHIPEGIYFINLKAEGISLTNKVVIIQ